MAETTLCELTEYQLKFVDAYMELGNKKKALLAAGYTGKGKHSTVVSQANHLFKTPKVYAEIERRRKEVAKENIINSKQIVGRLAKMFNGELTSEYVTKKGELINVPISFKNQIEAAKVLVGILGIEPPKEANKEKTPEQKLSEDMLEMTNALLQEPSDHQGQTD